MRIAALIVALSLAWPRPPVADVETRPKLVVQLVVDQMRADYVDRFKGDWHGGFHRLLAEGAWFRHAAYPYLNTVTCSGHATIATGAFPRTHGVVHNSWWDRTEGRAVSCTEDPDARNMGVGVVANGGDSARALGLPTLADELRQERSAHVVSLSLKERSAIMLAGHGGDAVVWVSDGWMTSSAYRMAAAVRPFIEANPIDGDYGKIWTRLLPERAYAEADEGLGESPPAGWARRFPHALVSSRGRPDPAYRALWQRSPFADSYLSRFAASLAQSMQLGRRGAIDFLAVSFSTPDLVGHAFGPRSQETHDVYARLDGTIGQLLDTLDRLVGRDRYVVALTSDHGVADIPEQTHHDGRSSGRISSRLLIDAVEDRVQATLGPGQYVAALIGNDLYFRPGVYERLRSSAGALVYVLAALTRHPGVSRVFRAEQFARRSASTDPEFRAATLSYKSGRSGDLVIVTKPGWMMAATGTTHGSASSDDQRVPILLMGRGIKPGEYTTPVTPADIAPTLAALCGLTLSKAEGHPLREAMADASVELERK